MTSFITKPNEEQMAVIDAATSGNKKILAINALAGTGKTTTLALLAHGPLADLKIQYITFNARAAQEGRQRFGKNTTACTAHSHAWRSFYPDTKQTMADVFGARLVQTSLYGEMAQAAIDDSRLHKAFASVAHALRLERSGWRGGISPLLQVIDEFMKSGDNRISRKHIPVGVMALAMRINATTHLDVLVTEAQKLWERQIDPTSTLPIPHGLYLKLLSLNPQPFNADVVLFDEAQDASAPMLAELWVKVVYDHLRIDRKILG